MTSYADKTAYPNIFNKVYWGWDSSTNQRPEDHIVNNRNRFIIDYDIESCKESNVPEYVANIYTTTDNEEKYVDHVEIYNTTDNHYIIISSPYGPSRPEKHLENGWIEIYKIYASDARTFMKRVPKRTKTAARINL